MNTQTSQSKVSFQLEDGVENRCELVRLTRHRLVFRIANPIIGLRVSEVIPALNVCIDHQEVYSGRATIGSIIHTGGGLICEAELDASGLTAILPLSSREANASYWTDRFQDFLAHWQSEYRLLPEFKAVIADMQNFLEEMRLWMDGVELEIRSAPPNHIEELERKVVDELSRPVVAAIDTFIDQFENLASGLSGEAEAVHQIHLRRQLHPLVMASPFAHRTFTKPLGYAGDYEVVAMMLRPPYEGPTLFAKLINVWLVGQAPAQAHRNRVTYLVRRLVEETARASHSGRRARVFNLGCGPADEVRRFILDEVISSQCSLTLLDFNEETIDRLREKLVPLAHRHRPGAGIQLVRKSVQQILKDSARPAKAELEAYDYVYCAGLFDYLTDSVCQRLMDVFYEMLAPGGLLVATNVSDTMNRTRPFRYSMEYILDWHLIYRDGVEFRKIAPKSAPSDAVKVISDETGVNVFIEVRKPDHG